MNFFFQSSLNQERPPNIKTTISWWLNSLYLERTSYHPISVSIASWLHFQHKASEYLFLFVVRLSSSSPFFNSRQLFAFHRQPWLVNLVFICCNNLCKSYAIKSAGIWIFSKAAKNKNSFASRICYFKVYDLKSWFSAGLLRLEIPASCDMVFFRIKVDQVTPIHNLCRKKIYSPD